MITTLRRPLAALVAALALVAGLAACGGEEEAREQGGAVPDARCQDNQAAGTVTYMTGYYWQASASILEVLAADELGYFDDVCLDVEIQPGSGDVSQNAKLLASGQITFSGLSQQDTITANLNGAAVTGVSSYSNAGLDILMTTPEITDLAQLKGKTLGHKGWVPMGVSAMLGEAGLSTDDVEQVKVGYDPTVLTRGQVDALVGFVSNEPNQLREAGEEVTVWEPSDYDVPGSIGAMAVNPEFAEQHPTAVEDFLRAVFHAYDHCAAEVEECLDIQGERAGAESDPDHERSVWTTEVETIADNPLPTGFGTIDEANIGRLAQVISTYGGQRVSARQAQSWFDGAYADAVVDDQGEVIWPAT